MHPLSRLACVVGLVAASLAPPATAAVPRTSPGWYDVTRFPDIQSAIDSCIANGGGVVYLPPGTYVLPRSRPTLHVWAEPRTGYARHGVTLLGDGPDVCEIQAPPGSRDTLLQVARDNASVRGISFAGRDSDTTSVGIVLGDGRPGSILKYATFRDVTVRHAGRWGLLVSPGGIAIISTFDNCRFMESSASRVGGLVRIDPGSTTIHFRGCTFEAFRHEGVHLDGTSGVTFTDCVFEGELDDSGPFLYARGSTDVSVQSGWFEDDALPDGRGGARSQWFVQLDGACHAWTFVGCSFMRDGATGTNAPRALQVLGTGAQACMGVMLVNPDIAVAGAADSTAAYVEIGADDSQVYVLGGIVRDTYAYRRIVLSDVDGLLELGGTTGLRLMRVPDAALVGRPLSERGRLVYNKDTRRLDLGTGGGWQGAGGGPR